jgi:hypothetical protein
MSHDRDQKLYTEDQVWKFVTQAITRVLYDAIATHESHGEHSIEVGWLRDYTDNIAVTFPRISPDE